MSTPDSRPSNGDEEQVDISGAPTSPDDIAFDECIGAIEDLMAGPVLRSRIEDFAFDHADKFDEGMEHGVELQAVHNEFKELVEETMKMHLASEVPHIPYERFLTLLRQRGADAVSGDVWDVLVGYTNFMTFKAEMLAHKVRLGVKLFEAFHSHHSLMLYMPPLTMQRVALCVRSSCILCHCVRFSRQVPKGEHGEDPFAAACISVKNLRDE